MTKDVVIVGGGVGGVLTANLLARKLPPGGARVRLVDATGMHVYQPGFLYVALGLASARWLARDTRSLLDRRVELVVDRVGGIDTQASRVHLEVGGSLPYDQLVIATGSTLDYDAIPHLREASYTFYSLPDAQRLREALRNFRGGTLVIGVAGLPYKCPPAPVEFAFLVDEFLRRRGLRDRTAIRFLSPLNRAFTIESASKLVAPIFAKRGIELNTFVNVESVDAEKHELSSLEGETLKFDLAVLVPPHKGADAAITSGLAGPGGWLGVDRHTLRVTGTENVHALGDATDLPISKSGSTAHFEAPVVTEEIVAAIAGRSPDQVGSRYGGKVVCFLETGRRQATILSFDYDHPPVPPRPSLLWHGAKWAFNRAYWYTVPRGRGV